MVVLTVDYELSKLVLNSVCCISFTLSVQVLPPSQNISMFRLFHSPALSTLIMNKERNNDKEY